MTRWRIALAVSLGLAAAATLQAGCDAARIIAPPLPVRAASANDFGVDIEFAEPLDRASAEEVTRYTVRAASGPGTLRSLYSATVVDTFYGRVVQILIADGPLPDTTDFIVETQDVRTLDGRSTGRRSATFRTGLSYRSPLRELFDSRCSSCHGASQAAGNYSTDSYDGLFGAGTDATPNLIAGNPSCLVIRKCRPGRSMWDAGQLSYLDFEMILNWVASYGARL